MNELESRRVFADIAEAWGLNRKQQRALMALGPEVLPHLTAIHNALQAMFPHNEALASLWPTTPNRGLGQRTPLDIILDRGVEGVMEVRRFVDLSE